jgi:hypothetical protein
MTIEIVGRARWSWRGTRRLAAHAPGRRALSWWRPWPVAAIDPPSHGESSTPRRDGGGPPPVGESGAPQAPKTPPRALPGRRTTRRSVTRRDLS